MPYILPDQRPELNDGQLNYVFTRLAHRCVEDRGLRYIHLNSLVGVFESAKAEFQRRVVAPYENKKIQENGGVSDVDGGLK